MPHVQTGSVSLAYGDRDILRGITLTLSCGDRCALAGANGSGKSSLMKIIAGLQTPDTGSITSSAGAKIVYLPQSGISHEGHTLREEIELVYAEITELIGRREELGDLLARTSPDSPDLNALLHEHHDVEERVLHSGYYDREAEIEQVLSGLGFRPSDAVRDTGEFSGGWQMRIALAKVLLGGPDFMLLDEPANYLDLETGLWLADHLAGFAGGVLLVSHDRSFLDQTVTVVWELFLGELRRYRGTYTAYEARREQEIEQIKRAWQDQQQERERIEDFVRRFRATASKARQVQSRVKQLEKMVPIEIPEHLKHVRITFPPAPRSGREVITGSAVARSYGKKRVLFGVDLVVHRGEKIALVGPNGAGKSTLMRILAGQDSDFAGQVVYGANVELGYYADDDTWLGKSGVSARACGRSVLDATLSAAHGQPEQRVRDLLGAFLFRGDDIHKDVAVLSGGERSRLAMLQLLLRPVNLLILDEPTNHLDMASKDVLLSALEQYTGTIIFVSHDRQFSERLASRVIEIRPDPTGPEAPSLLTDFPGDFSYYVWRLQHREELQPPDEPRRQGASRPNPQRGATPNRSVAVSEEEQRAGRNRARRLERDLERLLGEIELLERRVAEVHVELALPEVYESGTGVKTRRDELEELDRRIHELTGEWEFGSEELAALTQR